MRGRLKQTAFERQNAMESLNANPLSKIAEGTWGDFSGPMTTVTHGTERTAKKLISLTMRDGVPRPLTVVMGYARKSGSAGYPAVLLEFGNRGAFHQQVIDGAPGGKFSVTADSLNLSVWNESVRHNLRNDVATNFALIDNYFAFASLGSCSTPVPLTRTISEDVLAPAAFLEYDLTGAGNGNGLTSESGEIGAAHSIQVYRLGTQAISVGFQHEAPAAIVSDMMAIAANVYCPELIIPGGAMKFRIVNDGAANTHIRTVFKLRL